MTEPEPPPDISWVTFEDPHAGVAKGALLIFLAVLVVAVAGGVLVAWLASLLA